MGEAEHRIRQSHHCVQWGHRSERLGLGSEWQFIPWADGGVVYAGAAAIKLNEWNHVALVRSNGTATFYANGIAFGSVTNAPNTPSGRFAIAAAPQNLADNWYGSVDEV